MLASSLEMVKSGEYLTPHINSAIYFHKPPLYAWLTAIVFKIFGFTEFWGRFWAAVFGVAGVYLAYLFGRRIYNERVGLVSALILTFSPLYIVLSKIALVDVLLCFFITLSLYLFYLGYKEPGSRKWFYLMWLAMALATMTKGPLGIIVPMFSIVLYLLFEKNLAFIKQIQWLKGIIIYLLVASPWFIIETFREGPYFLKMIFGQFLFSIYMSPMQQHPGPFYYYLIVILIGFIPWSGFFISSLFKRPHGLLLSVFLVMLAIFSTASTKVPGYFLPAFPAMAIITAKFLDNVFEGKNKWPFYFGVILPIVILSITAWAILGVKIPMEYHQAVLYLQILVFLALAGFFLSFLFSFFKPNPAWTIGGFSFSILIFMIGLIVWLLPYAEDFKTSSDLAKATSGYEHVAFYKTWLPPSLVFYLNKQKYPTVIVEIKSIGELEKFLKGKNSAAYLPLSEEKLLKLPHKILKTKAQYAIILCKSKQKK